MSRSPAVALLALAGVASASTPFDKPTIIKQGANPLNESGQIMYPSPAIFDIDNDGADELVLGSISGTIHVCENTKSGATDEPAWGEPTILNAIDTKPLRFNNW